VIIKIRALLRDESERNLLINVMLAFIIKGASLLISLLSTPLYISFFDNQAVLGIWYTILSILSWISMCDLGLGNGLRNSLTVALAKCDFDKAKKLVSSTYISLAVLILPILVLGIIFINLLDFNRLLDLPQNVVNNTSLRQAVIILFCGICVSFILRIVNTVIYSIQKSSINNLLALITSIIPLLFVAFRDTQSINRSLIELSIVHIFAINIPLVLASALVFRKKPMKECKPRVSSFDICIGKEMLGLGMKFFLAQVFFMLLMSTNEVFISCFFSSQDVVEYSIYYRLFTAIGSLFMLALTPLWSKVTKDLAQKKYRVIKQTNYVLYFISLIAAVVQFCIPFVLQKVLDIWLGDNSFVIDYPTSFIFSLFGSLYVLNIVLTTIANGMGELRSQMVFYGIGSFLKLPFIAILTKLLPDINWSIVVLYNCLILIVFSVYQFIWVERRIRILLNNSEGSIT